MPTEELTELLNNITLKLFDFGPYALAALFLLYLAPKHTMRFISYQETNKKKQNLLLTVAVSNWAAAFFMCFYIYNNWSPVVTYQGSLGIHTEDSLFITVDSNSYIASHETGGNSLNWQFAFISSGGAIKQGESFKFTHQYKDTFNYYEIPANLLKKGNIKITSNSEDPSRLLLSNGEQPPSDFPPIVSYTPPDHLKHFMAAYAITPADSVSIVKKISSSNPNYQAIGLSKLRSLSTTDLQQLLQTPGLSEQARRHIQSTLSQRH